MTAARRRHRALLAAGVLLAGPWCAGCASATSTAPGCTSVTRLVLVAQSVPSAAYVPCVGELPTGWQVTAFRAERGRTTLSLLSDRAQGRAVQVGLTDGCDVAGATPEPARTPGGRTYLRLRGIAPRYVGTLYDVFPGGCVRYAFDFARGPHIALMEGLLSAIELVSRRQLRLDVRRELGEELDP